MKLFSLCIAVLLVLPIQAQEGKTSVSIVETSSISMVNPLIRIAIGKVIKSKVCYSTPVLVQGVFDDSNPETVVRFKYPDTQLWDAQRNTDEFCAAMKSWRDHGMLAFTLNLQGGSPMGYGNKEWQNSAFDNKGNLKIKYMNRVQQILDRADELGMVVILGYFYFGQDQYLDDESDVLNATYQSTKWILDRGYRNVIIEIANECNNKAYDQEILKTDRIDQLMRLVKNMKKDGHRLLVATSYNGNTLPTLM